MGYIHNKNVRSPAILLPDKEELWLHAKNRNEMNVIVPKGFDEFIVAHSISREAFGRGVNPLDEAIIEHVPKGDRPVI